MNEPFFSILLPTKNRSEILSRAIDSVLKQTFGDFELIVSDNDDSPEATAKVVKQYSDPRIRYFRTPGNLAMHQNWDNAFNQAQGRNVIILEDKFLLAPNALEILHRHLEKHPDTVVSFRVGTTEQTEVPPLPSSITPEEKSTESVVDAFCRFKQSDFVMMPMGLNSCVPRALLKEIQQGSATGFLYSYVCPDYASGFLVLSKIDRLFYFEENLASMRIFPVAAQYSNGEASYMKSPLAKRFLRELAVPKEEILSYVPVKTEWLWINFVLYDFHTKYKNPRHPAKIDWASYHAYCLVLILLMKEKGGDYKPEWEEVKKSLRQNSLGFKARVGGQIGWRIVEAVARRSAVKLKTLTGSSN